MKNGQLEFFATTAKGMESLLSEELLGFGAIDIKESKAGVSFKGPLEIGYRACLHSRIANRILCVLKTFIAVDADALYEEVQKIEWREHLTTKNTFAVTFSSIRSRLIENAIRHSHFGALKVKDAIVDQFRAHGGERPSIDPIYPELRVNVYLEGDVATVSIDLSGESLHKRGYREEGNEAPLKENLAAAILMLSNWTKKEGFDFLDPMCGSGTLPIEAALMASRTAPGLLRKSYGFLGWLQHDQTLWKRLQEEAKDNIIRDQKKLPKIAGYDRDIRALNLASSNAEKAGLLKLIHFEKRDFVNCEPLGTHGLLVINPPYGERLGEVNELKALYKQIGDVMKQKFKGYEGYIFTGNPDLAKSVGLKASRRFVLYNGPIECRLLKYELY
jgi:23S rRNA (guanine2445-N2)-methyltransferase / 23S rRNA (guanine2069-N7)-methyltransferase